MPSPLSHETSTPLSREIAQQINRATALGRCDPIYGFGSDASVVAEPMCNDESTWLHGEQASLVKDVILPYSHRINSFQGGIGVDSRPSLLFFMGN
ncbi:hypothetical protein ABZP36_029025 [Zizania latifolia]